jgi:hypothetical protein
MPAKYHRYISTELKKQSRDLPAQAITSDLNERQDMVLYYLKASGEFDAAVREWEQRPTGQKTWQNIKSSSEQSMQKKTSRTNSLQNNSKQP